MPIVGAGAARGHQGSLTGRYPDQRVKVAPQWLG
jgi:hypothetical protein